MLALTDIRIKRFHYELNAETATKPTAIGAILIHRHTGEEREIDILVDDDSFATVAAAIRWHYTCDWGIYETWEIND